MIEDPLFRNLNPQIFCQNRSTAEILLEEESSIILSSTADLLFEAIYIIEGQSLSLTDLPMRN